MPKGTCGRLTGGLQPSVAMGLPQPSPNEAEEEDLGTRVKEAHKEPRPFEAFGLPQSSSDEDAEGDLGTSAEDPQGERQPFDALRRPQSSSNDEEEEDMDTGTEESRGKPPPFEAFGLPQSSHNKEELETIAEEPVAESRASSSASKRPLEGSQQQQAPKEEHGLHASGMRSTRDQAGSQAQSMWDVSQPKEGPGVTENPRDAGEEAGEHMDTEGRGQAGHPHSYGSSEQPRHSLPGTPCPSTSSSTLLACQCLAGQRMHS